MSLKLVFALVALVFIFTSLGQCWDSYSPIGVSFATQPAGAIPYSVGDIRPGTYTIQVGSSEASKGASPPATFTTFGPYIFKPNKKYSLEIVCGYVPNPTINLREDPYFLEIYSKPSVGCFRLYVRNTCAGWYSVNLPGAGPCGAINPAGSIVGTWSWFTGDTVYINADGTYNSKNNLKGTWELTDPSNRIYTLRWDIGYVDTLTLSSDGKSLSGTNQYGHGVTGTITSVSDIIPAETIDIEGTWYMAGPINAGMPCQIVREGDALTIFNENGQQSSGRFIDSHTIEATDWEGGLRGTLSGDGSRIDWANGSWWVRNYPQPGY